MISFRDRAFCNQKCTNAKCSRLWTPELQAKANQWWGGPGAPVAFADLKTESCGYKPPEEGKR